MSLNIQPNYSIPQNNLAFKAKGVTTISNIRSKQKLMDAMNKLKQVAEKKEQKSALGRLLAKLNLQETNYPFQVKDMSGMIMPDLQRVSKIY